MSDPLPPSRSQSYQTVSSATQPPPAQVSPTPVAATPGPTPTNQGPRAPTINQEKPTSLQQSPKPPIQTTEPLSKPQLRTENPMTQTTVQSTPTVNSGPPGPLAQQTGVSKTPAPSIPSQTEGDSPLKRPQEVPDEAPVQDKGKKNPKTVILVLSSIFAIILLLIGIAYLLLSSADDDSLQTDNTELSADNAATDQETPDSNATLAPPGTTDYEKQNYRSTKTSIAEAQELQDELADTLGSIVIPDGLEFAHEEKYRGVTIKWTSGQPISPTTLSWLKEGLDILPEYFYSEHPAAAIISATHEELGSQGFDPNSMGAAAWASGLNIFLGSDYAKGSSTLHLVTRKTFIETLFHEWVHVVQQYEVLQTFSDEYLSIPGNLLVAFELAPFSKEYARQAGWVFQFDEYANSTYAILGDDAESNKITEYGKTKYVEDMAESGRLYMLCKTDQLSESRIQWWENTTDTNRQQFCPSPV